MTRALLVIRSDGLVDPVFLYGIDPFRNRDSQTTVDTLVIDDSDSGGSGNPHPVHRPNTEVVSCPEGPFRRGTEERLGIGLLHAWRNNYDLVYLLGDNAVPPNTFVSFYEKAMERPERLFSSPSGWLNPMGRDDCFSPSFPIHARESWDFDLRSPDPDQHYSVVAHMGLSRGYPEMSKIGLKRNIDHPGIRALSLAPTGYFPMSSLNLCIKREAIPAFLPVSLGSKSSSFLGGLFFQALARRRKDWVTLGRPIIRRISQSDDSHIEVQEQLVLGAFMAMLNRIVPKLSMGSYVDMIQEFNETFVIGDLAPWEKLFEKWPEMLMFWVDQLRKPS